MLVFFYQTAANYAFQRREFALQCLIKHINISFQSIELNHFLPSAYIGQPRLLINNNNNNFKEENPGLFIRNFCI